MIRLQSWVITACVTLLASPLSFAQDSEGVGGARTAPPETVDTAGCRHVANKTFALCIPDGYRCSAPVSHLLGENTSSTADWTFCTSDRFLLMFQFVPTESLVRDEAVKAVEQGLRDGWRSTTFAHADGYWTHSVTAGIWPNVDVHGYRIAALGDPGLINVFYSYPYKGREGDNPEAVYSEFLAPLSVTARYD